MKTDEPGMIRPAQAIFHATRFEGLKVVEIKPHQDERGTFVENWSAPTFAVNHLPAFQRTAFSENRAKLTLRGMHYQSPPHADDKMVRVNRGRIFDVAIDLRPDSKTFKMAHGLELAAGDMKMILIPQGFAHGYLTLEDHAEIMYYFSSPYVAGNAASVRWNDPAFDIRWPAPPAVISARDQNYADFQD